MWLVWIRATWYAGAMFTTDPSGLARQRVLITGASRRIGRAIACRLASRGATLALHYRSDEAGRAETTALLAAAGVPTARVAWFAADLGDAAACAALVPQVIERLGGLDLLVNNAAMFRRTPLETLTPGDFDVHMAVNARSVYTLCTHAGQHMQASGGGAIVNLADISGRRPWGSHIPYCASKAAALNLTRGFAHALAPTVRVNAVSPGSALPPTHPSEGSDAKETLIAGHSGAEAVAAAVELCLTASYLTGIDLVVDGGRSLL